MSSLAVAGPNSRVSLFELDSASDQWRSAQPAGCDGFWPVPRPGGEWTASVVDSSGRLEHHSAVGTSEVPGATTTPPALIGARLAHYAAWSPDGAQLCYVVPDGRALSLRTWDPGESGFHTHLSAAPVFPVWVPNTRWLVCHHGATLTAFNIETREQRTLSPAASGFRTPAVSMDGAVIAWAEVSDGAVLVHHGSLSGESEIVARLGGGVTLGFRPGTHELFGAVATSPESGVFSYVAHLANGPAQPERLVQGPLVAFWWSPDGEKIATFHPTYSGDGRFQVRLHRSDGKFLGAMEPLIPSADIATMVGFFDQYAVSHPSWSPDSRWFGISGKFLSEGPHPSFTGSRRDTAYLWDTAGHGAATPVAEGSLVVFQGPSGK
ncbi:MAG: hypothetical protein AB7N24_17580 [Dehalococcoidia bacterium]